MTDGLLGHQAGVAFLTTTGLEFLKRIPHLRASVMAIRVIACIIAAMSSFGFTLTMTGSWDSGGILMLHVPSGHETWDFILHLTTQLGLTEGAYRGIIKPVVGITPPLTEIHLKDS